MVHNSLGTAYYDFINSKYTNNYQMHYTAINNDDKGIFQHQNNNQTIHLIKSNTVVPSLFELSDSTIK